MSGIPTIVLRGDLTGTAFGGAPTWTDYSAYLETGDDGAPIRITWGKQDEAAAVQPARFSFMLNNTDGRFTTGGSIITTAHQFNVRVTVGGTTYDRATGYVEDVEVLYPGQAFCVVRVTCVDISGRLGEAQPLKSMVLHEMLTDAPTYLYAMSEASTATAVGDISGNGYAPATQQSGTTPTTLIFSADMPGFLDSATGVKFGDAYSASGSSGDVTVLAISGPVVPSAGAHTQECWFVAPSSNPPSGVDAYILYQGFPAFAILRVTGTNGYLRYLVEDASGSPQVEIATTASVCDGRLHHAVGVLAADQKTVSLYLDGQLVSSSAAASAMSLTGIAFNEIGGILASTSSGYQFPGIVGLVAMYPTALSATRILAHYQAGVGTGPVERTDQRYGRILGYASLTTTGLPTGAATMSGQKTAGRNLTETLKEIADTEGTDSFVTPSGTLTFQQRQIRQGPSSAFTLTNADINPDVTVRKDRLGLINDQTVTRDGGATQRVQDATSMTNYGRRDGGTLDIAASTDEDAYQNAAWRVAKGKDPQLRLSSLPVDLLTQPTTSLLQSILNATISTAFTITGMPSQTPGGTTMSLFVEGATETIGVDHWQVEFFTSPVTAVQSGALVLDSSTNGVLDTNRVGF